MKIADAMNTWPPALLVLVDSGCTLRADYDEAEDTMTWTAEIGSTTLVAANPLALLGLFSLWKAKGAAWSSQAGGNALYDRLLDGEIVREPLPR